MLTKKEFISILDILEEEKKLSDQLDEALKKYANDQVFTGFTNFRITDKILSWLKNTMNDKDDYIQWYYETPLSNIDCHKIYIKQNDHQETFTINTKEALYDLLTNSLQK